MSFLGGLISGKLKVIQFSAKKWDFVQTVPIYTSQVCVMTYMGDIYLGIYNRWYARIYVNTVPEIPKMDSERLWILLKINDTIFT